MPTDFEFRVTLDAEEQVDLRTVRETLKDVESLLRAIERELTGATRARWRWGEAVVDLDYVASVNGISAEQLGEVIETAREGFARAASTPQDVTAVDWPAAFNKQAQDRVGRILRRLSQLEAITIAATDVEPLRIQQANIGGIVTSKPSRRRVYSAVEGVLRMIAGGDKTIRAGLKERGTGVSVKVTLEGEWHERVRDLWDRLVVVEGRVAYRDDGRPLSIVDVSDIRQRPPGRPLLEFERAAPDLTGTSSTDDFIARARADE